jgi:hypothetical protein
VILQLSAFPNVPLKIRGAFGSEDASSRKAGSAFWYRAKLESQINRFQNGQSSSGLGFTSGSGFTSSNEKSFEYLEDHRGILIE